jgi:hypothetical protein
MAIRTNCKTRPLARHAREHGSGAGKTIGFYTPKTTMKFITIWKTIESNIPPLK